jgi:hypothetical protein
VVACRNVFKHKAACAARLFLQGKEKAFFWQQLNRSEVFDVSRESFLWFLIAGFAVKKNTRPIFSGLVSFYSFSGQWGRRD